MVTTSFAKASVTISSVIIDHVKNLYSMAVDEIVRKGGLQLQTSLNARLHYTSLAIPSYILATAAVEAYLNEVFLSNFSRLALGSSSEEVELCSDLEKLDLSSKLIEVPRAVVGRSLNRGQQPHQDMRLLIKLRNELVHYKMKEKPPTAVGVLARRNIVFRVPPEQEMGGPHPWADRVSTLEGIRWAHNTVCETAAALLNLIPNERCAHVEFLRYNFQKIP
jgi:hypothetical protein